MHGPRISHGVSVALQEFIHEDELAFLTCEKLINKSLTNAAGLRRTLCVVTAYTLAGPKFSNRPDLHAK
jgi:hypothetical protein